MFSVMVPEEPPAIVIVDDPAGTPVTTGCVTVSVTDDEVDPAKLVLPWYVAMIV